MPRPGREPLLTVVVNFHNLAHLAPQTLASLTRSADPRITFLLVDDASTDHTADLLEAATRTLPGAELLPLTTNQGLAGARHRGMEHLRTERFTFLDGDDWVAPGYYPALLDEVLATGLDWMRTDHVEVTGTTRTTVRIPDGNRGGRVGNPRAAIPLERTTSIDFPHAWSGVYHRRLRDEGIVHYPEQLRSAEDRPGIWRLHLRVPEFTIARTVGVFYRRGVAGSLTQTGDERQLAIIPSLRLVRDEVLADPEADRFWPKVVRTWCGLLASHWAARGRFTPQLRRRFTSEAGALLAEVEPALLRRTLAGMAEPRRHAVEDLQRRARLFEVLP
ncbi:glycosyl transferase [Enemella dayhoffiae]|uniref:Glycosyl transferase n=1 Tax=Enemella dayhoffiae TaxID=2016507 RepID=A0A255H964_9ACTN|nr:glycosyltransferase family 2 protein [Enemella dayhoffiae]OYO24328.1 glycosyl transferase [Enemella dayhoffiae]